MKKLIIIITKDKNIFPTPLRNIFHKMSPIDWFPVYKIFGKKLFLHWNLFSAKFICSYQLLSSFFHFV